VPTRRSIRSKLAMAFAVLALVPFAAGTLIAVVGAVGYLRTAAEETLAFDLEIARQAATRSLREASNHLDYAVHAVLRDELANPGLREDGEAIVRTFLERDSTAIVRVRAINAAGELVFQIGVGAFDTHPHEKEINLLGELGSAGELFYLIEGENTQPGSQRYMPVELRDPSARPEDLSVVPAIAILQPITDERGEFLGVAVAEADLPLLFATLDVASPGLAGTTGLVGPDGLFLYHSERKNDWASLLASRRTINLTTDFSAEVAEQILQGDEGTLRTGGSIVSYRALDRANILSPGLVLYRSVPLSAVDASVRRFALTTLLLGLAVLAAVLWMATVAASRITRPIYALSGAARELAAGGSVRPFEINTQDEIQDLAEDFTVMASSLQTHREHLEELVAERTHALEVARSELAQVVAHAADAIIGLDGGGTVRLWNAGAQELFGYDEQEAIGQAIHDLISPAGEAHRLEADHIRGAMAKGDVVTLQTIRRPKLGDAFPVALTQAPVTDDEGRTVGASLVIRDHRNQSRTEEQIRRSERLAAASIMATGLAHEINNPLGILANRIELMAREVDDGSSLKGDLKVLEEHVDRLKSLTRDLLRFARDDESPSEAVDLAAAVTRAATLFADNFVSSGVKLDLDTSESVPTVPGNEQALETVAVNLLLNAVQATPAGGTVRASVTTAYDGAFVRLVVEDTGVGIPQEVRSRVFEPFFTTKGAGGTGLGLAVCRTIMERHGGRLWIDDEYTSGTRFVADAPVSREEPL